MIIVICLVLIAMSTGLAFRIGYKLGVMSQQGKQVQTKSGVLVPERKKLTLREWEEVELKKKQRIESVFDNDGFIQEEAI